MARLVGRTAIVTGGAKGIGRHYSEALAAEGAGVVIADISGGEEAARDLASKYGANATMSVTCFGALRMVKAVLPAMKAAREGSIVNVRSMGSVQPYPGGAGYATAKEMPKIAETEGPAAIDPATGERLDTKVPETTPWVRNWVMSWFTKPEVTDEAGKAEKTAGTLRKAGAAIAVSASGGAGTGAVLPAEPNLVVLGGLMLAGLVLAVILVLKALREKQRAEAYRIVSAQQ